MNLAQQLFLEQARSDYEVFGFLEGQNPCHRLHYLQMSTEKLAKVYFWRNGRSPGLRHHGFASFIKDLEPRADFATLFGFSQVPIFLPVKAAVITLAEKIERLAPAHGNNGPNPEYPWPPQAPTEVPTRHPFSVWTDWNSTREGLALAYFVENMLIDYEVHFP